MQKKFCFWYGFVIHKPIPEANSYIPLLFALLVFAFESDFRAPGRALNLGASFRRCSGLGASAGTIRPQHVVLGFNRCVLDILQVKVGRP